MSSRKQLLVATDFSAAADAAYDAAIQLARLGGARITLVHVCEPTAEHGFADLSDEDVLERCRMQLAAARERGASACVEVATLLRSGTPSDKIHNAAAEVGATLIVVGREAGTLGHVADRVLRTASRPVLAVCRDAFARVS
jgi:nucleotide-binding universal stress UspA family protein